MNEIKIFENSEFGKVRTVEDETKNEYYGFVYALEFGNFVKIGCTRKPFERLNSLRRTIVNYAQKDMGRFALSCAHTNYCQNEKILHNIFQKYRVVSTELFMVDFDKAVEEMNNSIVLKDESKIMEEKSEITLKNLKNIFCKSIDMTDYENMSLEDIEKGIQLLEEYKMAREELIDFFGKFKFWTMEKLYITEKLLK